MQTLKEQLEASLAEFVREAPPEVLQLMQQANVELEAQGLEASALKVGDRAPEFELPGAGGWPVRLDQLLETGPVVLSFYRGGWCPYCNLELKALEKALGRIEEHDAKLVAVSPETPNNSLSVSERLALSFEVLSDQGNAVARQFGLVYTLPEILREPYKSFGIDLPAANGDDSFELPVPATFVLDKSGVIHFAHVDANYTRRAEPSDVIEALGRL